MRGDLEGLCGPVAPRREEERAPRAFEIARGVDRGLECRSVVADAITPPTEVTDVDPLGTRGPLSRRGQRGRNLRGGRRCERGAVVRTCAAGEQRDEPEERAPLVVVIDGLVVATGSQRAQGSPSEVSQQDPAENGTIRRWTQRWSIVKTRSCDRRGHGRGAA
jgi:hypothetical protein